MKYNIIALFGLAGSGKDYLQEQIMKTEYGQKNLNKIISYTTRPPREGELDGVNYHFVSYYDFNLDQMVEFSCFRNWWYGTSTKSLMRSKINIGVFNPEGVQTLLKNPKVDVKPIYVQATDKIRLIRQLTREESPDCKEICRRFETDKHDFSKIDFEYIELDNNQASDENEPAPALLQLENIIKEIKWVD